eukprot:COSAG02_NODE_978_length_15497_cov_11.288349_3_plen_83_part_00
MTREVLRLCGDDPALIDHNELAYLTPELHGAPFGAFACFQAPELGGATLLADCRRVLETLHVSLSLGEVSEQNGSVAFMLCI